MTVYNGLSRFNQRLLEIPLPEGYFPLQKSILRATDEGEAMIGFIFETELQFQLEQLLRHLCSAKTYKYNSLVILTSLKGQTSLTNPHTKFRSLSFLT